MTRSTSRSVRQKAMRAERKEGGYAGEGRRNRTATSVTFGEERIRYSEKVRRIRRKASDEVII